MSLSSPSACLSKKRNYPFEDEFKEEDLLPAVEEEIPFVMTELLEAICQDETKSGDFVNEPSGNMSHHVTEAVSDLSDDTKEENIYEFKQIPFQITGAWEEFSSKGRPDKLNNYTRGCKWAPDGSCLLSCSNDNILRLFNMPPELWDSSKWNDIVEMSPALKMKEGETIYDFCWYPLMNSADPASSCLASTSKNTPVHLWDAFTGETRCSYRAFDQMDEVTAARSLAFDSDGSRLFCGFENVVRVFNVDQPGRNCTQRKTYEKKCGQSGIISCFAFTPSNRNVSASGSYSRSIGIYSEPDGNLECVLEGSKGGITQLQFSTDGNLLYSGGRKDPEILCWDMRNLGNVLYCLRRSCLTSQRMYFDITRCGKYLISGNHNGIVSIWDLEAEAKEVNSIDHPALEPIQFFMAHEDCVNGISIHPLFPLLCSSSGQRKFPELLSDDEDGIFSSDIPNSDNSLRLWWIGKDS